MNIFKLRYPRLTWFGVGIGTGLIMLTIVITQNNQTIDVQKELYERTIVLQKQTLSKQMVKISQLKTERDNLKQQITTTKITNPDGSTEERTETNTDRQSTSTVQTDVLIESKVQIIQHRLETEYREKIQESRRYTLSVGYNSNFTPYFNGTYRFSNSLLLDFGLDKKLDYKLGIGISF